MNVGWKLGGFAGAVALAFGGAFATGAALDPTDPPPEAVPEVVAAPTEGHGGHGDPPAVESGAGTGSGHPADAGSVLSGLAVSQDGYALVPASTSVAAGPAAPPFTFRVMAPDGQPVADGYQIEAERELHLVVVRRDTATFQHLHPTRDHNGTWSTPLVLTEAGTYRAFVDFTVGGQRRVLATDLFVAGEFRPLQWPAPAADADADGYTLTLAAGMPRVGTETVLTFRVSRAGHPVTDLAPYLGEKGHLVALREGDLGYLHAHPASETHPAGAGAADEIRFAADFPTAGRYRLFLEFSAGDRVRSAIWTVEVNR